MTMKRCEIVAEAVMDDPLAHNGTWKAVCHCRAHGDVFNNLNPKDAPEMCPTGRMEALEERVSKLEQINYYGRVP